jgi:tripartite ATP-independent transporter DctM subunit|tara:strand:+ start:37735 stop:39099 length:1365 start_codon:yes stop_codon:yes gene_type:complete
MEWLAFVMFFAVIAVLLSGFPVALSLAGVALLFAAIGTLVGGFDSSLMHALPSRVYGIMTNQILMAVPLFVFMGVVLERAKIAERLLDAMAGLFGSLRGGLGLSVIIVGMLLAASTGIVGATVVTMGLLSLPTMIKRGYSPSLSAGIICASGTLGQIIPPSIILVLLADVLSNAYQQAQLSQGIFSPETLSVSDLFAGAIIPGLLLVSLYILYLLFVSWWRPEEVPASKDTNAIKLNWKQTLDALLPPLLLIIAVLGSITTGIATPTEAASVGAVGALLLAWRNNQLDLSCIQETSRTTVQVTCMVFAIFIAASLFSLVFRGYGGDDAVHAFLTQLPGGPLTAVAVVMLVMFVLGFVLDFIEITFVVVPIVGPILLAMGIDPIWLGIMIAINLQTSFLTPPFGFALFYLRGVASTQLTTQQLYRGVIPFVAIQVFTLFVLSRWPGLVTWLPSQL